MTFLTFERIRRVLDSRKHSIAKDLPQIYTHKNLEKHQKTTKVRELLRNKFPWKADFNQCTGSQLIKELTIADDMNKAEMVPLPFVLIGHSKLYTKNNELELKKVLKFGKANPGRIRFSTFGEFDENSLKEIC